MSIKVFINTHKDYEFPLHDDYIPLHVGSSLTSLKLPIQRDDNGKNISDKNGEFCELTGIFWAWKNTDYEYYGFCHYRRYFCLNDNHLVLKDSIIANPESLQEKFKKYSILLPKKRNYFIESIRSHYINAHHEDDLTLIESIIKKKFKDYAHSYEKVMSGTTISLFNMFVMKKTDFRNYCEWLFKILDIFELERNNQNDYKDYQKRVFGFLSERLLNVWVLKNFSENEILYLKVSNLEGENLLFKGYDLLKRKFFGFKKL